MSVVSVTATVEADNVPPRVRLNVVDNGSPFYFRTTVTRINPDGTTVPVRTPDGTPLQLTTSGSNRVGTLFDYEAPFGAAVSYSSVETPGTFSAQVTVPETRVWLIHPGVPALSMPVSLMAGSLAEETRSVRQGVYYPMGRKYPVVVTDGTRQAPQSSITVGTETLDELADLLALVENSDTLLLNVPTSTGYGVDATYLAAGEIRVARRTTIGSDPYRDVTLPFVVVDRPAGGTQAQRRLVDLFDFPTLASLGTAYPTLADLLAGP